MAASLSEAVFIAFFLESLMYGIALAMGCATVVVLFRTNSEGGTANRQLVLVLCMMLMVATPHIVISLIRAFRAFVLSPEHGSENIIENIIIADGRDHLLNAKNILFLIQTILGDGVNIWRLYVIYDKKFKYIITPSVIMLAGVVCGCLTINAYAHLAAAPIASLFDSIGQWAETSESMMIVTNIYCTVAVSWKIYKSTRFNTGGSHARSALVVIAETGLLYTSSISLCLALYVTRSTLLLIAMDLVLPLVPCIFCFMILHAQNNRIITSGATVFSVGALSPPSSDDTGSSWMRMRRMLGKVRTPSISSSRPVQIHISREEEDHYPGKDVVLA